MQLAAIRDALAGSAGAGPLHRDVSDGLARLIEAGALAPGERLPSERQLTELSGRSRVTIRKALALLAERGLVEQRQGSGTYVARPAGSAARAVLPVTSLTEELRRQGRASRTVWLTREIAPASLREITALGLCGPERVARLERLRLVDEQPLSVERSAFTTAALPDVSVVEQSIYAALAARNARPARVVQETTAVNMVPRDAERLQALPASAALKLTRRGYDAEGAAVEFTEAIFHPAAHRIVTEFGG